MAAGAQMLMMTWLRSPSYTPWDSLVRWSEGLNHPMDPIDLHARVRWRIPIWFYPNTPISWIRSMMAPCSSRCWGRTWTPVSPRTYYIKDIEHTEKIIDDGLVFENQNHWYHSKVFTPILRIKPISAWYIQKDLRSSRAKHAWGCKHPTIPTGKYVNKTYGMFMNWLYP